ncbi:hypothetical protein BJ165DRAFT_1504417 [Panaeolus papilionaceus]|nr:hypothetical protein BJ165DRAFT_1504417 [Panaeolus papilionaceus]
MPYLVSETLGLKIYKQYPMSLVSCTISCRWAEPRVSIFCSIAVVYCQFLLWTWSCMDPTHIAGGVAFQTKGVERLMCSLTTPLSAVLFSPWETSFPPYVQPSISCTHTRLKR